MDELESLLGESEALSVLQFILKSRLDKEDDSKHMYMLPPQEDKEKRRQLHLFFKKKYPFIHTTTSQSSIVLSTQRVESIPSFHIEFETKSQSKRTFETNRDFFSWNSSICTEENQHRALFSQIASLPASPRSRAGFGLCRNQRQKGHHHTVWHDPQYHGRSTLGSLFAASRR